MSMRALKTFLAIARHGTFAAAARDIARLHRAQDPELTQPRKVLSEEPFIWLARGSCTGRLIDHVLRQHRIQVQDVMELDMPELIAEMVARGFAVSIIPMYDGKWLIDPRLKIWRFDKPRIKRGVSLLQRRAHPRTVITMALLQCLLDVAKTNNRRPAIQGAIEL